MSRLLLCEVAFYAVAIKAKSAPRAAKMELVWLVDQNADHSSRHRCPVCVLQSRTFDNSNGRVSGVKGTLPASIDLL